MQPSEKSVVSSWHLDENSKLENLFAWGHKVNKERHWDKMCLEEIFLQLLSWLKLKPLASTFWISVCLFEPMKPSLIWSFITGKVLQTGQKPNPLKVSWFVFPQSRLVRWKEIWQTFDCYMFSFAVKQLALCHFTWHIFLLAETSCMSTGFLANPSSPAIR